MQTEEPQEYKNPKAEYTSVSINKRLLRHVDELIKAGYYTSRPDFLKCAIREKLDHIKKTGGII